MGSVDEVTLFRTRAQAVYFRTRAQAVYDRAVEAVLRIGILFKLYEKSQVPAKAKVNLHVGLVSELYSEAQTILSICNSKSQDELTAATIMAGMSTPVSNDKLDVWITDLQERIKYAGVVTATLERPV